MELTGINKTRKICGNAYGVKFHVTGILSNAAVRISNRQTVYDDAFNMGTEIVTMGHVVAQLVEAMRYTPEDRGFDFRWCNWNFSMT
jgi:hypothetical protein